MSSCRSQGFAPAAGALALLLVAACGDNGTAPAPATSLAFRPVADGPVRTALPVVAVEIHNASGGLVNATNPVTLALGNNPGRLIFHASGFDVDDRIIELVDPVSMVVLPTLQTSEGNNEMLALEYDPAAKVVYGTDADDILWSLDPVTGHRTEVGTMTVSYVKGIALEAGSGARLLGVSSVDANLYSIDRATAVVTTLGPLTISGDVVQKCTGLAIDPTSGTVYAVAVLASGRTLTLLDPTALTLTSVGVLSEDGVAGITFLPDGTLIAVTGDGATNPSELWSVDKATGVMTLIMALGNGANGEAITAVPADLSGTLTVPAVGGVASFSDLQISAPGAGYTLTASAPGLSGATSAGFAIAP
jgi:hypothetical protein